ncbi:MAG: hypothetical protein ACREMQ_20070, partial [Longimicrobiales bacterium]
SSASNEPPPPMTVAVWQDGGARLWTMIRVPAVQWRPRRIDPSVREQPVRPFGERDAEFDTIIEVLDVRTGALLASQRYSQYFVGNLNDDLVYSLRGTEDGDLRIDIWRIGLETNRRG